MTRHDDDKLASWLAIGPQSGPVGGLEDALARARGTRQRPAWLVAMTGGTIAAQRDNGVMRAMALAIAVVALVGLVLGALVAGGILPPPVFPEPSALANETAIPSASIAPETPEPTASATPIPPPPGLVAYTLMDELEVGQGDCTESAPPHWCLVQRIWIANVDGTDAHPLHPDDVDGETLIGWAPDGSGILHLGAEGITLSRITGKTIWAFSEDELCLSPCSGVDGVAFSPDGTRLAYAVPEQALGSIIAIFDIASGEVVELESTRANMGVADIGQCPFVDTCGGVNDGPRWSPDGTQLAFARQIISPEPGAPWTSAIVYVVNVDGSGLHRVSPEGFYAIDPRWSADGSRLAFMNSVMVVDAERTTVLREETDIYTVDPAASDLRRLTNDGRSHSPAWTAAGQVTYARWVQGSEEGQLANWIIDADGRDATRIGEGLAELTAAGCMICRYPPFFETFGDTVAYWQPLP